MKKHQNRQRNTRVLSGIRTTPATVADSGRVRMGLTSPSFPPVRTTPQNTADNGKVRLGLTSPSFPPVRTK